MKINKSVLLSLFTGVALCLGFSAKAETTTTFNTFTNAAVAVTNGQTLTLNTTNTLSITRGYNYSFWVAASATNSSTASITNTLDVTYNGTTWSTTHPFSFVDTLNGTNGIVSPHFVSAEALAGVRAVRWAQAINGHTSTVTMQLTHSRGN